MALIIDGKGTAQTIRQEITAEVAAATARGIRPPGLAVVIVGDNPASQVYVRNKAQASAEAGFMSRKYELAHTTSQAELLRLVAELNSNEQIDGILVQLPLPRQIDERAVLLAIDPDKDVDGFHPLNAGRLATGMDGFVPCTPLGCRELLLRHNLPTEGKRAVVLGRSNIVGTPMALLLSRKGPGGDATVTICHSKSADLAAECARADILVAAIGKAHFVTPEFVKPGAVVIDVGINRIPNPHDSSKTKLVGDVDYDAVFEKAGAITPVPGGVGPLTIAMLLGNTRQAWKRKVNA